MIGGHGHVIPRADGMRARCGGPMLCAQCAGELSDYTQNMIRLEQIYSLAFGRMIKACADAGHTGQAHRAGLLAVYMAGLENGRSTPKESPDTISVGGQRGME